MPSINLLLRGLMSFIVNGVTLLPLLKHGMDVYYYKKYLYETGQGDPCQKTLFPLVCYDDLGSTYLLSSEPWFSLAGMEDGCCGAAGVLLSVGAYDVEVEVHRKSTSRWRRVVRFVTGVVQIVIIVALGSALHIVTQDYVLDQQRTSLFVLLPALMLNIWSMIENFYEGAMVMLD
ncbi:hypothetical protein HDU76_001065 [Blyttiomyces sp. JEL0837]|nr:hypothetical protein HDU76_001065 [Blyttiomyces sp. JEL0837]